MNGAFYISGIGLGSQQGALDTIANNIANLNTPAFKRSDVRFAEIMSGGISSMALDGKLSTGPADLAGVRMTTTLAVSDQGALQMTDNPLDLAINGDGFIELLGPDGEPTLWRGGMLQVGEDGFLTADNGLMLAAQINIPDAATDMRIALDGTVSVAVESGEIEEIGQIQLVRVADLNGLVRMDGGFYRLNSDTRMRNAVPGEEGVGQLVQGSVERSNVDLNREMVEMMIVQRAYSANAQVVQAADQLLSIANNLRK